MKSENGPCRIWKRSKGIGPSNKKNLGRWKIKRSKPQKYWICALNWRQDGSHKGIPTGIKVARVWWLSCKPSFGFCIRYFHITPVVTADLVLLDLPNTESVPSGEVQLHSLRLLCMKRCRVHVLDLNEVYRSATAEARHSFKPRNSVSWTDRNFKFPNGRRPKGTFETKNIILGQAWGSSRCLLLCLKLLQRNPDFANMSDARATFNRGGPQNETFKRCHFWGKL